MKNKLLKFFYSEESTQLILKHLACVDSAECGILLIQVANESCFLRIKQKKTSILQESADFCILESADSYRMETNSRNFVNSQLALLYSSENGFGISLSCHSGRNFSTKCVQINVEPLNGKDSYTMTI